MMIKKVVLSIVITTVLLAIVLLLISPFLVTFGPTPLFNKIIGIFYYFPIDGVNSSMNVFLILSINSLFWSTIGHMIFYGSKTIFKRYR